MSTSSSSSSSNDEPTWERSSENSPSHPPLPTPYHGPTQIPKLSPELLTLIFHHCSTITDALSLAKANKLFHGVWTSNTPAIIWAVGQRSIRAFDDALMAVRATHLVIQAYKNEREPTIEIQQLSGENVKPTCEEFKKVLDMQHLVRCVEYMYLKSEIDATNLFGGPLKLSEFRHSQVEDLTPSELVAWKDRFYMANYRLLLAGAMLAPAYTAPFFEALDIGEDYLWRFVASYDIDDDADVDYLRKFPVYNFDVEDFTTVGKWRNEEYKKVFGPFAEWLVEDGKKRGSKSDTVRVQSRKRNQGAERGNGVAGAVEQLMCLLVAYEHLNSKFVRSIFENSLAYDNMKEGTRKVDVVLFGIFCPEQISMPGKVRESKRVFLRPDPHPELVGSKAAKVFDTIPIGHVLQQMQRHSRSRFVPDDENPPPPPIFELWFFALREYLALGFEEGAFWIWRESMWDEAVGGGYVFADPDWEICEDYKEGQVSWQRR